MNQNLMSEMSRVIELANKKGLTLIDEKELAYGVQLKFEKDGLTIPLNIYHSKKKGISFVIGGSPNSPLKKVIQNMLNMQISNENDSHSWKIWAGTDESGKGDFFGPLVVCGFVIKEDEVNKLKLIGVKDSKLLNDTEIEKIAKKIYQVFPDRINVLVLKPEKYNQLYQKFREQKKKLNEMLAWMHGRVILNLREKLPFEGAVVDKFAAEHTLRSSLKELKSIDLIQKIKGESDIAVAAASIIARYQFVQNMKFLSSKYGLDLPKGASGKVVKAGKNFAKTFGKDRLVEVAKMHFKTIESI